MSMFMWTYVAIVVFIAVFILLTLFHLERRRLVFENTYGVSLPSNVHVSSVGAGAEPELFLAYPRWMRSNPDGTAVDDSKYNSRVVSMSRLVIGDYALQSDDPAELYSLVRALREAGHAVAVCAQERDYLESRGIEASEYGVGLPDEALLAGYPADLRPAHL